MRCSSACTCCRGCQHATLGCYNSQRCCGRAYGAHARSSTLCSLCHVDLTHQTCSAPAAARLLTPRPYTTSEEVAARRAAAAVTIQRYSRGWMARLRADALRAIKDERDGFLAQAAAERTAAAQAERRCACVGRHEQQRSSSTLSFGTHDSRVKWAQQLCLAVAPTLRASREQPRML